MTKNIALVLGSFHKDLALEMLEEARAIANELGLNIVEEVWVPGSVEKPLALKKLLLRDDIDGAVALGIIERGETKHGMVMGQSLMHFVMQLMLETMKPIGLGVLGPEIEPHQIEPRVRPYARKAVVAVAAMLEE
ncbi:MAG: 6,7-dimethyl-8-ribityllumazine synthase [Candidatus Uhrbacteria bacterium]|nr:6,7-dimethyl-8-ribityllumazine synthase [Candidatus Uhrbacteria bacterium]